MGFLWEIYLKLGDKERMKIEEAWRYTWQTQIERKISNKNARKNTTQSQKHYRKKEIFYIDFKKKETIG